MLVRKRKHVSNNAHGLLGWIDIGAAGNVFLENVILHGAAELAYI